VCETRSSNVLFRNELSEEFSWETRSCPSFLMFDVGAHIDDISEPALSKAPDKEASNMFRIETGVCFEGSRLSPVSLVLAPVDVVLSIKVLGDGNFGSKTLHVEKIDLKKSYVGEW